ncbi:hypothetical protein [Streptomyces lydicus]|uniref:hypothetical protein n=1 Tax=Streptomyces lydicus TaxID=47763 RepID=UPI0036EBB0FF
MAGPGASPAPNAPIGAASWRGWARRSRRPGDATGRGTEVFVDVLTLAVPDLAEDPWDYHFAALLTLQNQSVMGRGAVGFDLEDIDGGATPHERARS